MVIRKTGRVFSGARPTGRQHLGNYLGVIKNYVDMPTFKDKVRDHPDSVNYGLVSYAVLMTADIVLHSADNMPVGIDSVRKMSKSLNNRIENSATPGQTTKRVKVMATDPNLKLGADPGNPDICNVYTMHKIFSAPGEVAIINTESRRAGISCVDCKLLYAQNLNANLAPFRAKREQLATDPHHTQDMLEDGAKRARLIAEQTMVDVRQAVGLP